MAVSSGVWCGGFGQAKMEEGCGGELLSEGCGFLSSFSIWSLFGEGFK